MLFSKYNRCIAEILNNGTEPEKIRLATMQGIAIVLRSTVRPTEVP